MYYSTIIERYCNTCQGEVPLGVWQRYWCNYAILYCNKVYEVDKCYQQYSFITKYSSTIC